MREQLHRPGILVVYLLAPLAALAVWLLGRAGLVHAWPFPVVVGAIAVAVLVAAATAVPWLRDRESKPKLNLKIAFQAAAVATVIYMTGWGPMLVIVFMIVAHENINLAGSETWRPVLFWCTLGLVSGQIAIQIDVAPSLVPVSRSWAVAALAEMALVATVRQLSLLAADKERAEEAVLNHEKRFRLLVNNASDVIALVDESYRVKQVSPAIERELGVEVAQFEGTDIVELFHPEDRERFRAMMEKAKVLPGDLLESECRALARRHDVPGRRRAARAWETEAAAEGWRWMEVSVVNLLTEKAASGLVVTLHDVTERRYQALHDALTGLPNRVHLQTIGSQAIDAARRRSGRCGLLLMDLDRFKEVNDTHGHHYGDELLKEVSARLARSVRQPDTVVRLGGDEFAVMLPEIADLAAAVQVSHRAMHALSAPFRVIDVTVEVGISVGIALFPENGDILGELMRKADAAMYEAKRTGAGYSVAA